LTPLCASTVLVCICTAAGFSQLPSAPSATPEEILRTSSDPEALVRAASALARSRDSRDLDLLAHFLRNAAFLSRLDKPGNPKAYHLGRIMAAMTEHATEGTASLCLTLEDDPVFLAEDARRGLLLEVLAAVKPMSDRAAALFRRTNLEGYFARNALLLAANGSPRALALFESMMLEKDVPVERRIDCLHLAVVPRRTELPVLQAAGRILAGAAERAIRNAVIESVFDFRREWFGIDSQIAKPRDWQFAPAQSRRLALSLADAALSRSDLDTRLRKEVSGARDAMRNELH
jgi:hypothetical protein